MKLPIPKLMIPELQVDKVFNPINELKWTDITVKEPVVYRSSDNAYIIRKLKNVKGNVMCELEMDDDKRMANIKELPGDIQKKILAQVNTINANL